MQIIEIALKGISKDSDLHRIINEKLNAYWYHKEQAEFHQKQMEKAMKDMKEHWESYAKEYEETKKFLENNPQIKKRLRPYGYLYPMVENIE